MIHNYLHGFPYSSMPAKQRSTWEDRDWSPHGSPPIRMSQIIKEITKWRAVKEVGQRVDEHRSESSNQSRLSDFLSK